MHFSFRFEACFKAMDAKNVLFFVLFQGMVTVIIYAADEDSKFHVQYSSRC